MKKAILLPVGIAFLLSSTIALSNPEDCKLIATVAEESTVETWNISDTMQVGLIYLKLVSDGEVIYEADGTIIGHIKRIDYSGPIPVTYLNHKIIFEDGSKLETKDDAAIPDFDPEIEIPEDSIPVLETMTQIWGTKALKWTHTDGIIAKGYITPEPGGENYFELSGTICLN